MTKITVLHEAEQELLEAVGYYESKCPGLGMDFLSEVESGLEMVIASRACGVIYRDVAAAPHLCPDLVAPLCRLPLVGGRESTSGRPRPGVPDCGGPSFRRAHRDLDADWSPFTQDRREATTGHPRHLWHHPPSDVRLAVAVGDRPGSAPAKLDRGPAGLAAFLPLYLVRVPREERMMPII